MIFWAVATVILAGTDHVGVAELSPLTVRGKDIVNAKGEVVSMRGTNFGGWLMMETWIPSLEMEWHDHLPRIAKEAGIEKELREAMEATGEFNDDEESIHSYIERLKKELPKHAQGAGLETFLRLLGKEPSIFAAKDMDDIFRQRFGDYGAGEIWNTYHNIWVTENDFQLARALGFNFIRIPFWYKWFERDEKPYEYNEYGFSYLDKAIDWAKEHSLYVMLDFHGAVGGQSPWDHTGELSRAEFFKNEEFQKRTAALWKAIAQRYGSDPTVFAYDLLNEPASAKGVDDWAAAHDLLYRAIRSVDPETIIIMEEGYKLESEPWIHSGFFPKPAEKGWNNVVYSLHFYSGADPVMGQAGEVADHLKRLKEVLRVGKMEQNRCGVPLYIGEFSTMGGHPNDLEGMRQFLTAFNTQGWHWSPWTFKYVNDDQQSSTWGVYQYNKPWIRTPNIYRDSKESILETIKLLNIENFSLCEPFANVMRECLVQPTAAADKGK